MTDRETQFVTVALVRYADACPPKALHSDCPFARELEGQRRCSHECRDVITRLSRPGHTKVTQFASQAFDAGQLLLSESGVVPDASWHTSSLIQVLERATLRPPAAPDGTYLVRRHVDATNALAFLSQRGHDPDILVRTGFSKALRYALTLWVVSHLAEGEPMRDDPTNGWLPILQTHLKEVELESNSGAGYLLAVAERTGFVAYVERWIATAPLLSVLDWKPHEVPAESTTRSPATSVDTRGTWAVDRFARTYLTQWGADSLREEYLFSRGAPCPLPAAEMRKRVVPVEAVAAEIARRSVENHRNTPIEGFVRQAVRLLNEDRRSEAAALFDAARIMDPDNAEAHNNYGFCVTVDNPSAAYDALVMAADLDVEPVAVNRINQAVALRQLGRLDEALAACEVAYQAPGLDDVSWLWEGITDTDNPSIREVIPGAYLCKLGAAIAVILQNVEVGEKWRSRAADWEDRSV